MSSLPIRRCRKSFRAPSRLARAARIGSAWQWSGAVYRTDLENDIQFIASGNGAANVGYFQNVGPTRRQGLELTGIGRWGALTLTLHYNHSEATFRSSFAAASPNNSTADPGGAIAVPAGSRIPGVPADSAKLRAGMGQRRALGARRVGRRRVRPVRARR